MNNNLELVKRWYKNKKLWAVGTLVLVVAIWAIFIRDKKGSAFETIVIERGDLVQTVSVTGKVRPAQEVDLQFESAGRVSAINYKVGSSVSSGAVIASLENQELQAAVTSAKADLEKTKRSFESLSNPAISSTLRVELDNARVNLEQVTKKADSDLAADYSNALNVMREATTQVDTSSVVLEYLRTTYFYKYENINNGIEDSQENVNIKMGLVLSAFEEIDRSGGVTPELYAKADAALVNLSSACQYLRSAFTFLQTQVEEKLYLVPSSTDRASINTEATAVSSDLSAVSSAIQAIADQKITNERNISDANAKLATAQSAFPTAEDILQKESVLLSAQSQLRKTLIVAPFAGTIGKIDVERGQTVNSTTVAVSLISAAKYQIEANITEIDVGKVSIGNPVTLTLDAYGSQVTFNAKVSSIDTAATIVEGVTTYKTTFDFDSDIDPNIRPNMTTNLDIQTAKKEGVISVPQRAVISRNGDKIVRIYLGDKTEPEERIVKLGMSGKDGYIEIISGLEEGERIITFVNE